MPSNLSPLVVRHRNRLARCSRGSARSAGIAVAVLIIIAGVVIWRMRSGGKWVSPEELDAGGSTSTSTSTGANPAVPPLSMTSPAVSGQATGMEVLPAGSPQPGAAPPGKVWSVEHGHWHDDVGAAPGGAATTMPIQVTPGGEMGMPPPGGALTPQPDGPVPPGKVWSPEHGHWHDDPAAMPGGAAATNPVQITPMPGGMPAPGGALTPQPDGPVPPGKVWSPEHGHWHDAP